MITLVRVQSLLMMVQDLDVYNRTISNSLIINGAYTSSYGNLFSSNTGTYTGTILMNAAASIGGNGTLTISSVIDDGGNNYTLTKIGTGTVYLTATNTYGGGTIIEDGSLGIANDDNLGDIPGSTDADHIQLGTSNATLFATADVTINTARGITLLADGNALGADSGDQLTYNGIITGDYNLTIARNASGTVVLGGTNTYSGYTNVSSGTLKISADANLGTAPAEATANHLYLSGGHLHTTATMTLNSNRGMHLNTSWSYLEVADTTTLTYDGIITGTSTSYDLVLNYSGTTGTLVLGGTSTYVGSTKIYDGTLSISDELNLGPTSCSNTDCIDLYNAGVLQITDDVTFGNNQGIKISNSDNTKILIATGKTLTLNHEFYNNGNGAYVLTINDGSHDGKLHMTTSAVATSNSAYFSFTDSTNGGFVVANGTLQLDDYRNLTYDSSYTSYLTMASGSTLILNETTQQQKLYLILQGATVELLQTQTWTGNVTLSGTNTFNVADGKTWTTSSGSWTNATDQTGAITKTGTGTLVLGNSTSTWTGLTTVTAGTLRTNTNNALGTSAGGVQVNGGVLDVRNTLADEITLNGGTLYGYNGTISSTITLSQNSTIEAGSNTYITGVITDGDNSYRVTKTGNGVLYLQSSSGNTYDGGTTISAGEIDVRNHNDNLGTGTVTINDGAGLDVYNRTISNSLIINGAYTSSYGNLFSSNTGTYTGTILMNAAASIGGNGTLTISSVIDDGGNNYTLTKIGTGTVILSGTNTYTGDTNVVNGTLRLIGALSESTDLIVAAGKTFDLQVSQTVASLDLDGTITNAAGTSSLTVLGTADIEGSITTTGTQDYEGPVTLTGDTTLTTSSAQITFDDTVNSESGETNDLTVTASVLQFDDVVGGLRTLGDIDITAGTLNLNGTITAATSLIVSDIYNLNADVVTEGAQTYYGDVVISNNISMTSNNSDIIFYGTVDSANSTRRNLTINLNNAGADSITAEVIFGSESTHTIGETNPLGVIIITGNLDLNAAVVDATSISVSGTSNLGADVTTTSTQTYTGAVVLGADITLTGTIINTQSTIGSVLNISAQGLNGWTNNAGTSLSSPTIFYNDGTNGREEILAGFNDIVKYSEVTGLGGQSVTVTFNWYKIDSWDNVEPLKIIVNGTQIFSSTFTNSTTNKSQTSSGYTTTFVNRKSNGNSGNYASYGNSNSGWYDSSFLVTITTPAINSFELKIDADSMQAASDESYGVRDFALSGGTSSKALTINGNLNADGAISGLSTLSVTGTSSLNGNVTSSSTQEYTGNVSISNDITLTTTDSNITFSSTVDGDGTARDLTIDMDNSGDGADGTVQFANTVGANNEFRCN